MIGPSISVVIPLYNKHAFIVEAVTSAAGQVPAPLEIIVVDDGSTDGGPALVQGLGLDTVRLVRQKNAGVSAARNAGMQAARGDWIAFLDADDRYSPGHLAVLVDLAQKYPQAGMLATGYCRLDATGHRTPVALVREAGLLRDFHGHWSRLTFTFTSAICLRTTLVRERSICFPLGERLGEDQDVWLRVAEVAPVAYAGTTLVDYRIDVAGSATAMTPAPVDLLPCYRRLQERLAAGLVPKPLRTGARRLVGSHWLNTASALRAAGQREVAWSLWRQPASRGNFTYWLRTGLRWLAAAGHVTANGGRK